MDKQGQFLSRLGLLGALSVLVAKPASADAIAEVTEVKLNPTPNGVEVILQTKDGQPLQTFSGRYGQTLFTDVITTRLRLKEGNNFRQNNPAPGISSVEVTSLDTNSIRVTVVGEAGVPTAQVTNRSGGLVLSLSPISGTTATSPRPTAPTRPTAEPDRVTTTPTLPNREPDAVTTTPTLPSREPDAVTPRTTLPSREPDAVTTTPTLPSREPEAVTPRTTLPSREPDTVTPRTTLPTPGEPGRLTTRPRRTTPASQSPTRRREQDELIVTATRSEEEVGDVPRSVTIIDREEIQQQATASRNLPDLLGNSIPSLGPPNQSSRSFGQSLRGRRPLVLIDGVPVSTNLSTAYATELRSIDPSAIERIEVVRGPSAIYGEGGSGGVINIITRRAGDRRFTATSQIGVNSSLTNSKDSIGYNLQQEFTGREGKVDYTTTFSVATAGRAYDAEGDLIPLVGVDASESTTVNILAKVGIDFTAEQRLQVSINHFDDRQQVDYISDPSLNDTPEKEKARALERDFDFINATGPVNRNTVASLNYTHSNILGSQVALQGYYRDNTSSGLFSDFRIFNPDSAIDIANSVQQTERLGGKLQIETPVFQTARLLWGADYVRENVKQPFEIFDVAEYDASGGRILRKTGEVPFVPPYEVNSLGFFGQLQWDISEQFIFSGGLRHERIGFSVDNYVTAEAQRQIQGGELDFNATVFNAGLVYKPVEDISLFANFSQGFSVPDFGRILRRPPRQLTSVTDGLDVLEPIKVNNYEIGVRGDWRKVQASLSAFYNSSELGSTLVVGQGGLLEIVRAPQRIYGLEATIDWEPGAGFTVGSTLSYNIGENDADEDGDYQALDSSIVQPLKLTAYVEHQTLRSWRNRLQLLYVGDRDAGFESGADGAPIESYFTLDYLSSIDVGPGTLQIGVQNLLNKQYSTVQSQWLGGFEDSSNTAARGRTLTLNYRFTW